MPPRKGRRPALDAPLPFRPHPQEDELLSSWLMRLCAGLGIAPFTLLHTYWPDRRSALGQDIDNLAPGFLLEGMRIATECPPGLAGLTTLSELEGRMAHSMNARGRKTWILPVTTASQARRRAGLQCCPACLLEDDRPYFRRTWRLGFATACTRHGTRLIDRCPACAAPLAPHLGTAPTTCRCGLDLRRAPASPADADAVVWQAAQQVSLMRGWAALGPDVVQFSPLYFDTVRQVATLLVNGPRAAALRDAAARRWGGDPAPFDKMTARQPIEYLENGDRHRLFDLVRRVMADWPHRFVEACQAAGVWRSFASKDMHPIPFAFDGVLRGCLDADPYKATGPEVRNAAAWLRRTRGRSTYADLKKLVGESRIHLLANMDRLRALPAPRRAAPPASDQRIPHTGP